MQLDHLVKQIGEMGQLRVVKSTSLNLPSFSSFACRQPVFASFAPSSNTLSFVDFSPPPETVFLLELLVI